MASFISGPPRRRCVKRWTCWKPTAQHLDALRLRAFPFPDAVSEFIATHEKVFVVEQNRDAQMRSMLVNELHFDPARLVPVLHYDGTPITARFIVQAIRDNIQPASANASAPARQKETA
jgi:2-oxoglutarate ferredoxin oxidoreductase subunit alpha